MKRALKVLLSLLLVTCLVSTLKHSGVNDVSVRSVVMPAVVSEDIQPEQPDNFTQREILSLINRKSRKHGVDPKLVRTIVWAESNYDPRAVSPVGAMGLMQLMPATARGLGVKDPFCPAQNLDGGIKHLKWLLKKYGYNIELTLAAYNAGHTRVKGEVPDIPETQKYVAKILAAYNGG